MVSEAWPLAIVMLKDAEALAGVDAESVTCSVKVELPAVVGMPLIIPVLLRLKPDGRLPVIMLQV